MTTKVDRYLVFVWGDVEPQICGPYVDESAQDKAAIALRREEGDRHGIYWLVIVDGIPEIGAYSGGFMDDGLAEYEEEEAMA